VLWTCACILGLIAGRKYYENHDAFTPGELATIKSEGFKSPSDAVELNELCGLKRVTHLSRGQMAFLKSYAESPETLPAMDVCQVIKDVSDENTALSCVPLVQEIRTQNQPVAWFLQDLPSLWRKQGCILAASEVANQPRSAVGSGA
jgi:hypothetical protein